MKKKRKVEYKFGESTRDRLFTLLSAPNCNIHTHIYQNRTSTKRNDAKIGQENRRKGSSSSSNTREKKILRIQLQKFAIGVLVCYANAVCTAAALEWRQCRSESKSTLVPHSTAFLSFHIQFCWYFSFSCAMCYTQYVLYERDRLWMCAQVGLELGFVIDSLVVLLTKGLCM